MRPPRTRTKLYPRVHTCLACARPLGTNEVIEQFPVGRRLAFDAARGRLWVVCPSCRRWNLSPLEERWEAIEEAERRFRDTRLRVSTGQVGLARLNEGLELVRVGEPLRPEIAAWRYGEQFSRRRRRQIAVAGAIAAGGGAVLLGGLAVGFGVVTIMQLGHGVWSVAENGWPGATIARFRADDGSLVRIRRADLARSELRAGRDGGLAFRLAHEHGRADVEGAQAVQVARRLLPGINRQGGTPDEVMSAVERLDRAGSVERFLADTARRAERLTRVVPPGELRTFANPEAVARSSGLLALSTSLGLAMEMALNEDQERRFLEGELAALEAEWRQAEEIGAIADSMFLPEPVERALALLKETRHRGQ